MSVQDYEEVDSAFAQAWNSAESPADAAEKLNLRVSVASMRASLLRRYKPHLEVKYFKTRSGKHHRKEEREQVASRRAAEEERRSNLDWENLRDIDVAETLGLTRERARQLRKVYAPETRGMARERLRKERAKKFIEIWSTASSLKEVMEKFGASAGKVFWWKRRVIALGMELPPQPWRQPKPWSTRDRFVDTWNASDSILDVAETLGIKPSSARTQAFRAVREGIELKKLEGGPTGQRLPGRGVHTTDDDLTAAFEAHRGCIRHIAEAIDLSATTVTKRLEGLGLYKTRPHINQEDFVAICGQAESMAEAAMELGLAETSVRARIKRLTARGVSVEFAAAT